MKLLDLFKEKISFQEKLFLTKHLSTMIKAGISIDEALDTIASQSRNDTVKKILTDIATQVKNGQSLSESLEEYKHIFSGLYINLVKVGEKSGTLEESLEFLANHLTKQYTLKKKVKGAMMYPALIFFATIVMGGFVALYILPQLVDFFEAFDFPLPFATRILLGAANISKDYGAYILTGVLILFVFLSWLVNLRTVKPIWHRVLLKIPLFGKLQSYDQLANFSRNFGVLVESGLPIDQALEVTAETLSNLKFKNSVKKMSTALKSGKKISQTMEKKEFSEFPGLVTKMIGVGEKTGKLDSTLIYLGDFYEEEIDYISKNLSTIIEPFLLLGIGVIVAFVAFAIISPIYELTGSISR